MINFEIVYKLKERKLREREVRERELKERKNRDMGIARMIS